MRFASRAFVALAVSLASSLADAGPGHHGRSYHAYPHRPHVVRTITVFAPVYALPRYYPVPVYVAPPAPAVYIEQPQAPSQAWWYYCPQYGAYYPHVQSCPVPWQRVVPQPPPG
jgi:hypothetical protein